MFIKIYTYPAMKLQSYDPNLISITEIRRDISKLNQILEEREEALVIKNQEVYFVALSPKKYQELKNRKQEKKEAVLMVNELREKYGEDVKENVSEYVSKMRDERKEKWKK